jgi:hypothetical protein
MKISLINIIIGFIVGIFVGAAASLHIQKEALINKVKPQIYQCDTEIYAEIGDLLVEISNLNSKYSEALQECEQREQQYIVHALEIKDNK